MAMAIDAADRLKPESTSLPPGRRAALPALALWLALAIGLMMGLMPRATAASTETVRVASKRFTESYIVGEILRLTMAPVAQVRHLRGLGNTSIVFQALLAGEVDLYPEYSGTLETEILKLPQPASAQAVQAALARQGLTIAQRLGYDNGYAIAMREAVAQKLGIETLDDLARHPELRLGLSHEFIGRADGWPGLAQAYGLRQQPTGLDHGLAYQALEQGKIDAMDVYGTDARIQSLGLRLLADDRHYFPRYDAIVIARQDLAQRAPQAWQRLQTLAGRISQQDMIRMNAAAELQGQDFTSIARGFLEQGHGQEKAQAQAPAPQGFMARLFGPDLPRLALQHSLLVLASVLLASIVAIPLGVAAARLPRLGRILLPLAGMLQTIPSLAMLAMLIPLVGGIGLWPAVLALLLYALLPVMGNTATGMLALPPGLRQAGLALGLKPSQVLLHIELPLAAPTILSGMRTATIINIGTATIAAFIGAGGFGERIVTGLALNDTDLLLAGALPAAAMALLAQLAFALVERRLQSYRS